MDGAVGMKIGRFSSQFIDGESMMDVDVFSVVHDLQVHSISLMFIFVQYPFPISLCPICLSVCNFLFSSPTPPPSLSLSLFFLSIDVSVPLCLRT